MVKHDYVTFGIFVLSFDSFMTQVILFRITNQIHSYIIDKIVQIGLHVLA